MHELTDLLHGTRLRTTGQRVENKKTEAEGVDEGLTFQSILRDCRLRKDTLTAD